MFKVSIIYEGKKTLESIQKEFNNQLSEKEILKTTAGALNVTARKVLTQVKKEIKKEGYTINTKYLNRMASLSKPAKGTVEGLYARISYSYSPIPMIGFKHKGEPTKRSKGKRNPIIVEIHKGNPILLRHAWIGTTASGHTGIFAKGMFVKGQFVKGLKGSNGGTIFEQRSASPFTMATNKRVEDKIIDNIKGQLPKRLRAMLQVKINKLTK